MTPERFEDLLDAFETAGGDEDGLAVAFREQVIHDLEEAKRLLEQGRSERAEELLAEALGTARVIVGDRGRPSTSETEGPYRVVIADDNPTRRSLHRTLLEEAGPFEVVAETDEGPRILDAVRARAPDLVLLDVATPDEEPLQALPELEHVAPEVAVAVVPAFDDDGFAARARENGADLYLEEDVGGAELVDRLRELAAGGRAR